MNEAENTLIIIIIIIILDTKLLFSLVFDLVDFLFKNYSFREYHSLAHFNG